MYSISLLLVSFVSWIVDKSVATSGSPYALTTLEPFNVNHDWVTLSGFSSGGTFAQQMYFSHSSVIAGIAVFSHTYYRCGPGNGVLEDYDAVCTLARPQPPKNKNMTMNKNQMRTLFKRNRRKKKKLYNSNKALADIHRYARAGLIDDPYLHMKSKPLYIFAGKRNYLFSLDMSLRINKIFKPFIKNNKAIKVRIADANLTLPSNRKDLNLPGCSEATNKIQVSNCGISGAFEALQFLLGTDAVRKIPKKGVLKLQPLQQFDQTEFFHGVGRHDMDTTGYLYVPKICQNKEIPCLLHFYFHGCSTGRQFVGPHHVVGSGFLEAAESNGIILVFPQALSSPENNIGCFDTFGVTGKLYATKRGGQVTVVKNMLDKILGTQLIASDELPVLPTPSLTSLNRPIIKKSPSSSSKASKTISKIMKGFSSLPTIKCSSVTNCILYKN